MTRRVRAGAGKVPLSGPGASRMRGPRWDVVLASLRLQPWPDRRQGPRSFARCLDGLRDDPSRPCRFWYAHREDREATACRAPPGGGRTTATAEATVPAVWRDGVTGPRPFVFVHGAGADASRFVRLGERLTNRTALDLPGHGEAPGPPVERVEAMADAVLRAIRRAGWQEPILVGHSMGGAVVLTVALHLVEASARGDATAPDPGVRLAGLGLLGTAARLKVAPAILEPLAEGRLPEPFLPYLYGPTARPKDVDLEATALGRAVRSGLLYADFRACDAFDVTAQAGKVDLPAAIVTGANDRMTPPRQGERLRAWFAEPARVTLTVVEGSGHYVMVERPDETAAALCDLRERIARSAAAVP